jgi:hypothetical protein
MHACLTGRLSCFGRVRCSRMIHEMAIWVGILVVSTAVLFGFLTGESIQIQALSVLVFGIVPAAVVTVLAAMLVCLLKLLGLVYDLLTTAVAHRVHVRAVELVQATTAGLIWTRRLAKRVVQATRNGRAHVVREIALEVVWGQQVAARCIATMLFVVGWPIRSSARLLLSFGNGSGLLPPNCGRRLDQPDLG